MAPGPNSKKLGRINQIILPETLLIAVLCLTDMGWTIMAIKMGIARESNPFMAFLIGRSTMLFAIIKILSFLIPLALLELMRGRNPGLILVSLRIGLVAYVVLYVLGSMHVHGLI